MVVRSMTIRPLIIAGIIAMALFSMRVELVLRDNFIPFVRGGSEIVDLYVQSWNLIHARSSQSAFLVDQATHDPGSNEGANIYFHAPNMTHRLIGVGIAFISDDLRTFTRVALYVFGALAIVMLLLLWAQLGTWLPSAVLFGFMLFDAMSFSGFLNTYRSIQFVLFYGMLALLAWQLNEGSRWTVLTTALFFVLLWQLEIVFALVLSVAYAAALLMLYPPFMIRTLATAIGASIAAVAGFLFQVHSVYRSRGRSIGDVVADFTGVIDVRNATLYVTRTGPRVPIDAVISDQVFNSGRYLPPRDAVEFAHDIGYLIASRYGWLLAIITVGASIGIWRAIARPDFSERADFRLMIIACAGLLLGVAGASTLFSGYVSYMYGITFYPLFQFPVALGAAAATIGLATLNRHAGAIAAAGLVALVYWDTHARVDSRSDNPALTGTHWVNPTFALLDTRTSAAMRGARLASNIDLSGYALSMTGRRSVVARESLPDDASYFLCVMSGPPCIDLGPDWRVIVDRDGVVFALMITAPIRP